MKLQTNLLDTMSSILKPHAEALDIAIETDRLEKSSDQRDYPGKYKKPIIEIRAELQAQNEKINEINLRVRELIDTQLVIKNPFIKVTSAKIISPGEVEMLRRVSIQSKPEVSEIRLFEQTIRLCRDKAKVFIDNAIEVYEISEGAFSKDVKNHLPSDLRSCMPTFNGNNYDMNFENLAKNFLYELPHNCSEQSETDMLARIKFVEWFVNNK